MNAYEVKPHEYKKDITGPVAGLHAQLTQQHCDSRTRLAANVAAQTAFRGYYIKRNACFQTTNRVLPEMRLTDDLRTLKISPTPNLVYKSDHTPLAVIAEDGAMFFTQNVPPREQELLLAEDLSKLDEARQKRAVFYLDKWKLPLPAGLNRAVMTNEAYELLETKCGDDTHIAQLVIGGEQMAIFNSGTTITVAEQPRGRVSAEAWYDELGAGALLPLADSFVEKLNNGTVTNFVCRITPAPDGSGTMLRVEVSFRVQGEQITHHQIRRKVDYDGGGALVCSYAEYGAMIYTDETMHVFPAKESSCLTFGGTNWRVSEVRGGIEYVSVYRGKQALGVVKLPRFQRSASASSVTLAADLGETSFALAMRVDNGRPRQVTFDAKRELFPLICINDATRTAIANTSWFPTTFTGFSRSISQFFKGTQGQQLADPKPYSVARPFINNEDYSIAHTEENGMYTGFKSEMIVRNGRANTKSYAYQGACAAILMLGVHEALKYSSTVHLRLSYPNNPAYRRKFEANMNRSMELIYGTLTDAQNRGFRFSSVQYRSEAGCCMVAVERVGINNMLGTNLGNCAGSDSGGSTVDVSMRTESGEKVQMPAIPIAGKAVTLSSLIQVARRLEGPNRCGLHTALRGIRGGMQTVLDQQIIEPIRKRLAQNSNSAGALMEMPDDPVLLEAMQTLLDYFTINTDNTQGQLLQSLVCAKDLMLQDVVLRQCRKVFTAEDLKHSPLYLLRLGNGSRCCELVGESGNPFQNNRREMDLVLQERAAHYLPEGAKMEIIYNSQPKTEVVNGLCTYVEEKDAVVVNNMEYDQKVLSLEALEQDYLEMAIERVDELAQWLRVSVPRICGDIQPFHSGLDNGFEQLMSELTTKSLCRGALKDTINHENERFGDIYLVSAELAVDVWAMYAIMDSIDRVLARSQAEWMHENGVI